MLCACRGRHALDYPGALQHVISRGVGRCRIFDDSGDRKVFLEWPGGPLKKSNTRCPARSLTLSHLHLLLRTGRWPHRFPRTRGDRPANQELRGRKAGKAATPAGVRWLLCICFTM
jgi:hypothetical protein